MMLTAIAKHFLSDLVADAETPKAKVRLSGLSPTRSFGCSSRRRMRESYSLTRENGATFHFAPKNLYVFAECTHCARKLRARKPSLFNPFEIFDHTGVGDTSSLGTLFLKIQKCADPTASQFGSYQGTFAMTGS
jgi:hypothetical protein